MKFKVIHKWQDLDLELEIGDIIDLNPEEVKTGRERIEKYHDNSYDLIGYGHYRVPLTYLEEVMKTLICPKCKAEPESWVEWSSCSTEYTVQEDDSFEELDRDYYGETIFDCPECGAKWDMSFEEIWKGIKANIKKHEGGKKI